MVFLFFGFLFFLDGTVFDGEDLSKHDNGGTFQDGDTAETFASFETFACEGLLGFKMALGHFVGLEEGSFSRFLTTSGFADFPVDLGELDSRAAGTDEGNRGVARFELTGVVQDLDLSTERVDLVDRGIFLVNHDITNVGHVFLGQTLDVQTNVVTSVGGFVSGVVHFDSEHFTSAGQVGGISGDEFSVPGLTAPCSTRPVMTSPTPLIL